MSCEKHSLINVLKATALIWTWKTLVKIQKEAYRSSLCFSPLIRIAEEMAKNVPCGNLNSDTLLLLMCLALRNKLKTELINNNR